MISLIITVKNEHAGLGAWLASIRAQSLQPDEIVIVDGGSTDGTWEWLQEQASDLIKVYQHAGNISSGRNYAITKASHEIIAVTDAGCVYKSDWLKQLTAPLRAGDAAFASTAFFPWLEKTDGLLPLLLAAATTPAPREFRGLWLPSSRSVTFTKSVWQAAGGYPEWIPICEDIIFDKVILRQGTTLKSDNTPLVGWRPRPSLAAYGKQLYRYTKSDGHGKLHIKRQLIRYAVYGTLLVCLLAVPSLWSYWLVPVLLGAAMYMKKFWQRLAVYSAGRSMIFRAVGMILVPVVVGYGDLAKMIGYPVGVVERLTGKVQFQEWR